MKTPEIEVLEALLALCGQMARRTGPVARAASERHAKLSAEHAKLMRGLEREPEPVKPTTMEVAA